MGLEAVGECLTESQVSGKLGQATRKKMKKHGVLWNLSLRIYKYVGNKLIGF
jgi:hypothetical protein